MKTNFLVVLFLFNLLLLNKLNAQNAKFVEYRWHPANATTTSKGLPDRLLTDELFKVEITMQNNGTTTWGNAVEKTKVTMVSKNNNFNMNWGTYFISIGQGNNVAPGASFTFWSWLKAPHEPGDYVFSWQCQEWLPSDPNLPPDTASAFFGDITTPQTITVCKEQKQLPNK